MTSNVKGATQSRAERKAERIRDKEDASVANADEIIRITRKVANIIHKEHERGFNPTIHVSGGVLQMVAAYKIGERRYRKVRGTRNVGDDMAVEVDMSEVEVI